MQHIIAQDELPPKACLHAHLKGISELGAHIIIDQLRGEADYVFLLDDGTLCETADHALGLLAERLQTDTTTLHRALLYDVNTYATFGCSRS